MNSALDGPCFNYPLEKISPTKKEVESFAGLSYNKEKLTINFNNDQEPDNSPLKIRDDSYFLFNFPRGSDGVKISEIESEVDGCATCKAMSQNNEKDSGELLRTPGRPHPWWTSSLWWTEISESNFNNIQIESTVYFGGDKCYCPGTGNPISAAKGCCISSITICQPSMAILGKIFIFNHFCINSMIRVYKNINNM